LKFGRILVTGGAGFIGSHLVDALINSGYEVVVFDNLWTGKIEYLEGHMRNSAFRFVEGDVRDGHAVSKALDGGEVVFHLAAITSVPYSVKNPRVTREVNVAGTRNLLEASLRSHVERFVFVSSCAVYGEPEYLPIDESHPLRPVSPYAESKLEAERVCKAFEEEHGLGTVVFRLFNVYGLRMRRDQYSGVISCFIERLKAEKSPVIYGDGEQTRDFVHVSDVVRAMMLALENDNAMGKTFNIGSGKPTTIKSLAQLLIDIVGAKGVKPVYRRARVGDIRHSYSDISRVKDVLGFEPRFSLKEGLLTLFQDLS
jgi:UDP-glucose 4-epimerase